MAWCIYSRGASCASGRPRYGDVENSATRRPWPIQVRISKDRGVASLLGSSWRLGAGTIGVSMSRPYPGSWKLYRQEDGFPFTQVTTQPRCPKGLHFVPRVRIAKTHHELGECEPQKDV